MAFSVAEWRARFGPEDVELPSGGVAQLRRVHLLDLVAQGVVPATLVAEFEALQNRAETTDVLESMERVKGFREMLNAVSKAAFVMPPVADEGSEEQLGVDEVPFEDRFYVFRWCTEGARKLEPFRPEPAGDVGGAPVGGDVRDEAE